MKQSGKRGARRARVRVQESRHGRSLIVDETFASFYSADSPLTGSVWDAIAAPLLALAPGRRKRVLVLGLGGGSVARIVRALAPEAEIVGVELDADVVRAAREHFDLDALGVTVHVEDALAFLERDRRSYDAIFEDVFVGYGDDVHKPSWIPEPGHALAARRLRAGGLLVSNTLDEAPRVARWLRARYPALVRLEVTDYDNRIFAAGPENLDARVLRARVAAHPVLAASLGALRFRGMKGRVAPPRSR